MHLLKHYTLSLFFILTFGLGGAFAGNLFAEPLVVLGANGTSFSVLDTDDLTSAISSSTISGLQTNETILGIDFRPLDGSLYGVGDSNRLYVINLNSGAATQIGTGEFSTPLSGSLTDIDFNPVVDRIRVVTTSEQNLRINPETGALVAVDSSVAYDASDASVGQDPNIHGIAYTNNFFGAHSTTLLALDTELDALVTIGGAGGSPSPNAGVMFTLGELGVDSEGVGSLDISAISGQAYAMLRFGTVGATYLYGIGLGTGIPMYQLGAVTGSSIAFPTLDSTIPTVTVSSPSRSSVSTARAAYSFSGTADDNQFVSAVLYSVVSPSGRVGAYKSATGTTNWSFRATGLRKGRNTVKVKSVDLQGNESTISVYHVRRR